MACSGEDIGTLSDSQQARLRRLLPVELARALDTPDAIDQPSAAALRAHVQAMVTAAEGALPAWVLHTALDESRPVAAEATLLMADLAGFTALTSRLEAMGRDGNERLTELVNRTFVPLVDWSLAYRGDLLAYAGDAILVAFGGADHAARALAAACAMQRAMRELPPLVLASWPEPVAPTLRVGLSGGRLLCISAGPPERRLALALGSVLVRASDMADAAAPGGIAVDAKAAQQLVRRGLVLPGANSVARLTLEGLETSEQQPAPDPRALSLTQLALRALDLGTYLPEALVSQLVGQRRVVPGSGQQRRVASLFVHLSGLHRLADELPPALAARAAALALGRLRDVIESYGGMLARVDCYADGHKLVSLFGAPRARERDGTRATLAALALRERLPALRDELHALLSAHGAAADARPELLRLRCGVNLGQVVAGIVGTARRWEYTVMGDSVNVAARLMGAGNLEHASILAGPGIIERLGDALEGSDHELSFKGKAAPLRVRAVAALHSPTATDLSPTPELVGRLDELQQLDLAADDLRHGRSSLIVLAGEAGVGKSRLVREFVDDLPAGITCARSDPPSLAPLAFSLLHKPLRDLILCAGQPAGDGDNWFEAGLAALCPQHAQELRPPLRALLGLPAAGDGQGMIIQEGIDPIEMLAQAAWAVLDAASRRQPLALVLEDVHAFDVESREMLARLLRRLGQSPILVLATLRTEPDARGADAGERLAEAGRESFVAVAQFPLSPLDADASARLLDDLLPGLAPEAQLALLERAAGNPLFLEVLVQAVRRRNVLREGQRGWRLVAPLDALALPLDLRDLVGEQLDALTGDLREMLQAATVLASAEPAIQPERLRALLDLPPDAARERLRALEEAQVLATGAGEAAGYRFRHALYQQVAYDRLLSSDRRELHRRAGRALHALAAPEREARVEVLAYHCYEGGEWELALRYGLAAGEQARGRYANREARRFLRQTLGIARRLGQAADVAAAREGLGALATLRGRYAAARAQLGRALEATATEVQAPAQIETRMRRLRLLALAYERTSDYAAAERECRAALPLATELPTPSLEVARLHAQLAEILFQRGDLAGASAACDDGRAFLPPPPAAARERALLLRWRGLVDGELNQLKEAIGTLEQSLALAREAGDAALTAQILMSIGTYAEPLGMVEHARICYEESMLISERIGDVSNWLKTTLNLAVLLQIRGLYPRAIAYLQRCCGLSARHAMPALLADAITNLGYIAYMQGRLDEAAALLQQAYRQYVEQDEPISQADALYRLGDVMLACGESRVACDYGQQALALAREAGSLVYQGCALRIIGEAHLALGRLDTALLNEAYQLLDRAGETWDSALALLALGNLAHLIGDRARAVESYAEARERAYLMDAPFLIERAEAALRAIGEL
jgi:adenylate cyclase